MAPLYTHAVGEGVPVIIVHGWEMNGIVEATDFEPVFLTSPGFKRIYIDLPGMGDSAMDGVQDLDQIYTYLRDTVQNLTRDQRFLLIGSSCGAYLCRALVHDFSTQVDGVLFRVPLIEPDNEKRDLDEFKVLISDKDHMTGLNPSDARLFEDSVIQRPAYLELKKGRIELSQSAVMMSDKGLAKIRNDVLKYRLTQPLDVAKGFMAPALILCGRHDGVVGFRDAWKLMELYPRASFVVLDRAGHDLPVDEGELFVSLVRDWLGRVLEYRLG